MRRALVLLLLASAACRPSAGSTPTKKIEPAKVENAVKEGKLATVTLTPKAVERLGIVTAPVEKRSVPRARTLGGEIVVPPGSVVTVSAPLAGTIGPVKGVPVPGAAVKRGEVLMHLMPLLPPESKVTFAASQAQAEGAVEQAKVRLEAAKVVLARAERLLRDKAGSVRDVDDAKAGVSLAVAAVRAAENEKQALEKAIVDLEAGSVSPIPLVSPLDGVLRRIHTGPGQQVPAGGPLFEILDATKVWVRVPVYVGDLQTLETESEVRVVSPGARPGGAGVAARPVAAPPSADSDAASADLFYLLDNASGAFRPGQKVGVTVALKEPEESLVVPWAAVLHDFLGGTWVYEQTKPQVFVRRRVQVRHVVGGVAVLDGGPPPGTKIVTDGAGQLFGTEFPTWK